jgi:hypothetical protein
MRRHIMTPYYMQYYIFIIAVPLVSMPVPVGTLDMKFNIACKGNIINFYAGFQEIRTLVGIILARLDNVQDRTVNGTQLTPVKILELPDKLEKAFSHMLSS